jgi:diguanylate cyclase (GGDEF)-like protein
MSEHNDNKNRLEHGDSAQSSVPAPVPGMILFYGLWVGLATLSTIIGHSQISIGGALFILGGITSTNFFFLTVGRSEPANSDFARLLAAYETVMGIGWTSVYFYFSTGSGDLVLGMYMTVLMFALIYMSTSALLKFSGVALLSYVAILTLKILTSEAAAYPLGDSLRLLVLLAVAGWIYIFARQLRDLRFQLQYRNEELQTVVERVTRIAEEDHLTKSYNRRYIMDVLARERSLADRSGNSFAVLLFDLDHFKNINDRYGHLIGDQILTDFAKRVKIELRGMDSVNPTDNKRSFGRYGGEEFLAVLPDTGLLGAHRCADRIREAIAAHSFRDRYDITVSVGVAEYQLGETVPQLLTRADQALYQAKRDGRNRVRCSERPIESHPETVTKLRILK